MRFIVLFALISLGWQCKKIDLPIVTDPQQAKPIFEMVTDIAGKPLRLTAGVNNVILNTNFQSSAFEVLTVEGALRNQNCSANCKQSLQLLLRYRMRDFLKDTARSLLPGRLSFFRGAPDSLMLKTKNNSVLATSNSVKYNFVWTIDSKKFSDKESIGFNVKPNSKSQVCLTIQHPDGSKANQCQAIDFASLDSFPGLKVSIVPVQLPNKTWSLTARAEGIGPFKYFWDNKSNLPNAELDIKSASNQCITIYDSRNNTASACIDLETEARVKSRADFDLIYDMTSLRDFTQFNTVEITYTDENGQAWTTANVNQKQNSFFEIIQVSPYQDNELKQRTKKLQINFVADFYNAAKSSIAIKGSGTMAVAYPK